MLDGAPQDAPAENQGGPSDKNTLESVFRIRIYYYEDPGPYFFPFGSGWIRWNLEIPKNSSKIKIKFES